MSRPDRSPDDASATGSRHSFAGRLLASLRALASPPGKLTADWMRGKRVGYLPPFSLFLWINVAFFLVQSASGLGILTWPLRAHLADDSIGWLSARLLAQHRPDVAATDAVYADLFNALEAVHAKSLVIVMVPAFALLAGAMLIDRRESFRNALTFATHFFTFALIWLCALFPAVAIVLRLMIAGGMPQPSSHALDLVVTGLEAGVLGWYLYVALGTAFGLGRARRMLTVVILIAGLFVILRVYHVIVFAVTLYST